MVETCRSTAVASWMHCGFCRIFFRIYSDTYGQTDTDTLRWTGRHRQTQADRQTLMDQIEEFSGLGCTPEE